MRGRWMDTSMMWITYLVLSSAASGVLCEVCAFSLATYNVLTNNYDRVLTFEHCQWGCCHNSSSPCCPVHISLVVGVILGGVTGVAIGTAVLCYCCVYRKNQPCINAFRRLRRRQPSHPTSNPQTCVIFHAGASESVVLPPYLRYSDAPPSYDEVMKGQENPAFILGPGEVGS